MSEIKNFWNDVHTRQDCISLTNSDGPTELGVLRIDPASLVAKTILAIGVGTCNPAKFYQQKGGNVYALDISPIALENVKPYTLGQFLPEDELPENKFDYVFSNNICIHMSHEDFESQLAKIIKSLKAGGIYALQFSHLDDRLIPIHPDGHWAIDLYQQDDLKAQTWGAVFRSPGRILQLVEKHGGKMAYLSPPGYHSYIDNIFGYATHITKQG